MKKFNLISGQYVHLDIDDEETNEYREAYVVSVFDKFAMLKLDTGTLFRYDFATQNSTISLVIPTRDGQIIMAKRGFFGGHKTKPEDMK